MRSFGELTLARLVAIQWGAWSLVSLYISIISGIVVAFQYDVDAPFYSSGSLDIILPFGRFMRSLHYFSSQFFFVLLLIHLVVVLFDKRLGRRQSQPDSSNKDVQPNVCTDGYLRWFDGKWTLLTLSVPVSALVLFTGYILRFDGTGESAGYIAENITRSIPVFGRWLDSFLFNISSAGLKVVYVNHVVGLGCLWGYLVWNHLRKYRVRITEYGALIVCMLCVSYLFPAPIEPAWPGNFHILGPWFFVGLQELLRYLQPFLAGVVFPVVALVFMILAVGDEGRLRWPLKGTVLFCVFYACLTVIGLSR